MDNKLARRISWMALLAAGASGCSHNLVRETADSVSLHSLYDARLEGHTVQGTRAYGGGQNPCFSVEDAEVKVGDFIQWCRAALEAERLTVVAYQHAADEAAAQPSQTLRLGDYIRLADYANERYLDAGIALSNQLCEAYFERMGLNDNFLEFTRSFTGDLSTATSAIQAATGVSQNAIAATAATFGLMGSTLEGGRRHLAFDGHINSIYYLVRAHRRNYLMQMETSGVAPISFWEIYDWLGTYHATCSRTSISVLIDEALTRRATSAAPNSGTQVLISERARRALSGALGLESLLSDNDITLAVAMASLGKTWRQLNDAIPGANDTRLTVTPTTEGQPATHVPLGAFFGNAENRLILSNQLILAGDGVLGAFRERAQQAIDTGRLEAAQRPTPGDSPGGLSPNTSDVHSDRAEPEPAQAEAPG